ncbi:MAG: lysozyme inhibitor LprI family protein [Cyanobacteria bacterium J06632_3]
MRYVLALKALGYCLVLAGFARVGMRPAKASTQSIMQNANGSVVEEAEEASEVLLPLASGESEQRIPGVVQPVCRGEAQIPLNRCAARWRELTEQLHREVLSEIQGELIGDQRMLQMLAAVEESWIVFRDRHCDRISQEVLGGSLHPMVLNRCLARLNNERIAALHGWEAGWRDLEISERDAQRQLTIAYNALLAEANPPNSPYTLEPALLQLQWKTYREQHCRFEGIYKGFFDLQIGEIRLPNAEIAIAKLAEQDCQSRLAIERISQLEALTTLSR